MMLVLATLCLLVGSSFGAATGGRMGGNGGKAAGNGGMTMAGGDANSTVPTMMCCLPSQWESTIVDLNANGSLYALRFAHDDMSMRQGYFVTKFGPADDKPFMMVFKDFADKKTYTVDMSTSDPKDYTCKQTANYEHFFAGCQHKDATVHDIHYIGDATVGPASSGLHYDGWAFKIDNELEVTMSLSRDGCVPLMESVKSPVGTFPNINVMLMYNDFVPMIEHKELLTIPAACVNAGSAVVG